MHFRVCVGIVSICDNRICFCFPTWTDVALVLSKHLVLLDSKNLGGEMSEVNGSEDANILSKNLSSVSRSVDQSWKINS